MSDIERDLIGRDLRERAIYVKAYSVSTQEGIETIRRYIQDYRDYLTTEDLHCTTLCLVECGQINGMAAKLADPIIQEVRELLRVQREREGA